MKKKVNLFIIFYLHMQNLHLFSKNEFIIDEFNFIKILLNVLKLFLFNERLEDEEKKILEIYFLQ